MSAPNVNELTGVVTVTPGSSPPGAAAATSYNVGVRSLTAAGSKAGTYPIMGVIAASASPLAITLGALGVTTPDTYAVAAQAVTAVGTTAWGAEFDFTVVVLPNPPTVAVA